MKKIKISTLSFVGLAACLSMSGPASAGVDEAAQARRFPDRQVRLIVPSTPGGATDFLARVVGARLGKKWGQTVVIENRPGAGGIIGSEFVSNAPPDGYTLLIVATGYTVNPAVYKKLPYDTLSGFSPVTLLASTTHVLVAHPSVPAKNIKELLAAVRKSPGKLSYATSGLGTGGYLCGELIKKEGKLDMLSVPYKGAGQAATAVLGGQTDMMFTQIGPVMPSIQNGSLIALATTSLTRSSSLPDVPTLAESGIPGFEVDAWAGLLAPPGTPKAVLEKLRNDIKEVVNLPEVREQLMSQGYSPVASSPDDFKKQIEREVAKWSDLIRQAGIQPEAR